MSEQEVTQPRQENAPETTTTVGSLSFYTEMSTFRRILLMTLGVWFIIIQVRFFQEGGAGFSVPYIMELIKVGAAFFLLTTFSQVFANILVLTGLVSVAIYASGWFFTTNKTVVSLVGQFHALMKALLGTPNATHLGVTILSIILLVAGWYLLDDTKLVELPDEEEVTPS